MTYAEKLVYEYVIAGFTKIHLDTSMRLASDPPDEPLADSVVAERGARLCRVSEDAFAERKKSYPESKPPVYIIGSEVPIPGGTQSEEEESQITSPEDCKNTYNTYKEVFSRNGLDNAFDRVIAIVVQTGVEFGDNDIFEYNSEKAVSLTEYGKKNLPIIFEGHSTDYQSESSLRAMIEDGIAFLKVGPALTFALREALFSLEMMEKEIYFGTTWNASNFSEVLESAMLANPGYWQNHYHGDELSQRFARKYSFSDRARYYLNEPSVKESVKCLIGNINKADIHMSILSQFFSRELFELMRCKKVFSAEDIINTYIGFYLDDYYRALMPFNKPINGGPL